MKVRFKKPTLDQLDFITSLLGAIAGIAELLVFRNWLSEDDGHFIIGMSLIAWGFFCNKPPRIRNSRQSLANPELLDELRE
jgi:hypothetical protein